jgi:hypothetical protein
VSRRALPKGSKWGGVGGTLPFLPTAYHSASSTVKNKLVSSSGLPGSDLWEYFSHPLSLGTFLIWAFSVCASWELQSFAGYLPKVRAGNLGPALDMRQLKPGRRVFGCKNFNGFLGYPF